MGMEAWTRCPFGEHAIHPAELPERHTDLVGRAQAPLPVVLIRDEGPQVAHLHGVSHAELGVIFNSQGRLVSLLGGGEALFLEGVKEARAETRPLTAPCGDRGAQNCR